MNNMNQDKGMQKRMLIMTLVVFAFFIAYEFLVLKPQQEEKAKQAEIVKQEAQNKAPDIVSTNTSGVTQAPMSQGDMTKSISALSTKSVPTSEIITTITTSRNIIQIDKLGRVAQVTLLEEKYKDEEGNSFKLFESNQLRPLEVRFQCRS